MGDFQDRLPGESAPEPVQEKQGQDPTHHWDFNQQ